MTLNIYSQYFSARLLFNDVPRRAAMVMLVCTSEAGNVQYEAAVTFFPHNDEEDYAVSYDAYFSKVIYEGKGRRSKKREQQLLAEFRDHIDELAQQAGGEVHWEQPLREARWG
jgi:hypothetical protein